jgi:hypothetical protein
VKLNRELLLRENSTKEEMLLAPESGVRHCIDLKNRENKVRELGPWPNLIYSTAHSHKYATEASILVLLDS